MLTLALETATERADAALIAEDCLIARWRADTRQDLCRRLAAEVSRLFAEAGRGFDELDLIAVGLGPGSFTSLRIGLATGKAIALARDLPLVGVPSLAAMAWQMRADLPQPVCAVLDARRGDLYAGLYRALADSVESLEPEFAADPAALAERARDWTEPVTIFGQLDAELEAGLSAALPKRHSIRHRQTVLPEAAAVAHLGHARYQCRGADELAALRPIYVRKSYAEEHFDIDLGLR